MNVLKNISTLEVAARLGLHPKGKNYSCFNKSAHKNGDRNPSLSISEKGFNCFACGVKGNNVELVKQVLSCSFEDALRWLKQEFNFNSTISIKHNTDKGNDKKVTSKDVEVYNKLFAIAGEIDNRHWEYLKGRGFSKMALDCGVTNVKHDTGKQLKNVFSMEELLHSGVFSLSNKSSKPYFTFFAHSLIFPFKYMEEIFFIQGRTIEEGKFKYRNLAKEIEYPYNVNILLNSDVGKEKVLICEGVIDTLTMLDNGYNAIGIIGAKNFKREWVELFDNNEVVPIIALDNDDAGTIGAESIVKIFKRSLTRYKPNKGKDWNELR